MAEIKIHYQDQDVLLVEKPAGVAVFTEGNITGETFIDQLIAQCPELADAGEAPRYGVVHRLDKDTSGLLLVAKRPEALIFLQKQFKNREVGKKYTALAVGLVEAQTGTIHTLLGRSKSDPRKQAAHSLGYTGKSDLREAISEYKVLERFAEYTLLEVEIKTGRKHQIRCQLAYIHHPVAGDKLYGFKDSPTPEGLARQFLHASYLRLTLPNGKTEEFTSDLPEDLQKILSNLNRPAE